MKKVIFVFCFFLPVLIANSQNLVPNNSFEVYDTCPTFDGEQINLAVPWYSPTRGTPDYFNTCGSLWFSVPNNVWGFQYPRTGDAYAEIAVYGSSDGGTSYLHSIREYIQVKLIDSLIAGKKYCVSFYVSPAGISNIVEFTPIATKRIGLLFSNDSILSSDPFPLLYAPQIISPSDVFLNDTAGWTEISGTYTALGGEKFITIGNFKNDSLTDTLVMGNPGHDPQGYYYVDDVSIIDCTDAVAEYQDPFHINLFPNPNDGNMTLSYTIHSNDEGVMVIYDLTGKKIREFKLNFSTDKLEINSFDLKSGMYFYRVMMNGNIVKSDKLIIVNK